MWPNWLTDLVKTQVFDVIDNDSRTTAGTYLGWPRDRIFADVIVGGRADFAAGCGRLSADDKALLYARYNQRRHFDELIEAFSRLQADDKSLLDRCTIIDLGCGPFTAGLAFAAVLGAGHPFTYFGVDCAGSMLALGHRFHQFARQRDALHPDTVCEFLASLADIPPCSPRHGRLTVVVASYLLASDSFDAQATITELDRVLDGIGPGPVVVLYTNSALPERNIKFPLFAAELQRARFILAASGEEVFYGTKNPSKLRYALFYRPFGQIALES